MKPRTGSSEANEHVQREGHGVFSWAVLDALLHADYDDNGRVDVTDIATHVRKHVPAITEQKFKHRQVKSIIIDLSGRGA